MRPASSAACPGRSGGPPRYEIFHDVLAPAVLAWRTRHEAERALERERAAARRRHRRLAVVAAVALVALAGTTALAVWALSQRADAREAGARCGCRRAGCEGARARGERDREAGPRPRARAAAGDARSPTGAGGLDRGRAQADAARVPRANGGEAGISGQRSRCTARWHARRRHRARRRAARQRGNARPRRRRAAAWRPDVAVRAAGAHRARPDDDRPQPASWERGRNRPGSSGHPLRHVGAARPADSSLRASVGQASSARTASCSRRCRTQLACTAPRSARTDC